jgi:manganese oxidase
MNRRDILKASAVLAVASRASAAPADVARAEAPRASKGAASASGRVVTPNGTTLPYKMKNGVKVMRLVAQVVQNEFAPGLAAECWGYNGSTPGPTIELVEGDRVRFYVKNELPEATTVHWHGVILESGMDGVAGLTQRAIAPGETYRYEFTVKYPGTFMYHPHFDEMTQMALGMNGMFIVHPKRMTSENTVERDYAIMLHEWQILPGMKRPNPLAMMDFNVLTMNSKVFPATAPLVAQKGERVRIRLGNLSPMDHHPIHLHGYNFRITATDGGPVPRSAQQPETTVLVPVGATRDIEFVAENVGDWAMHCHMTHHVMTQMGHDFPNLIGVNTRGLDARVSKLVPGYMTMGAEGMGGMGDMNMPNPKNSIPMKGGKGPHGTIDMGGMFTILKVRDRVDENTASSWYDAPTETIARKATAQELADDGIDG